MTKASDTDPVRMLRVGRGEPLVLIHPFTTNARIWRGVAEELADRFDILMVTLPGHFGADKACLGDLTISGMAAHVERAMDELGWETAHIAGNSLGGWLALELGARGRALSVTALAPAGGWRRRDLRLTLPLAAKFTLIGPFAVLGRVAEPVLRDWSLAHRVMLGLVSGDWRKVDPRDSASMLRASAHCSGYLALLANARHAGIDALADVQVPVRLVLCDKDVILPPGKYGRRFEELLPDVHTVLLEGVGHVPMLEAPDLVAELIAEHALGRTVPLAV